MSLRIALERWVVGREPSIPDAFLSHLLQAAESTGGTGGSQELAATMGGNGPKGAQSSTPMGADLGAPPLTSLGIRALAEALGRAGADRETAFLLLSADAFLTYACEASTGETDPRRELEEALARVGRAFI